MIAEQALALVQQQSQGDAVIQAASLRSLQSGISEMIGSMTVALGLSSAAARLALSAAVVLAVYGLIDQANQDIKLVPASSSPWLALMSPFIMITLMVFGITVLNRLQGITPAAAITFSLLHRTFTVKSREAVSVWHGGKTLGEQGVWLWRCVALFTWVLGYSVAWVSAVALYAVSFIFACGTLASKYYVLKCNLRQAFGDRRVRMLALHCPNVLVATDIRHTIISLCAKCRLLPCL